ncbi:MAG TPA: alpha/beta fold hydrolase [Longimicrobiaceae bacterium]|nr:alpha/beta fold hydrolase [Longimicrobiaceae bacterium]
MRAAALVVLALLLPGCALLRRGAPVSEGHVPLNGDARLHYRIAGTGPDTIVVLHDGPALHMGAIAPDLAPLARRHVLVLYDQVGGGRSDPGASPPAGSVTGWYSDPLLNTVQANHLEALRRHLGMERMTLLGHGWGAGLAALYATQRRDRVDRLVLLAPIPPAKHPYAPEAEARLRARLGPDSARLDSLAARWATAADPRAVCRELFRLRHAAMAATPRAARRIRARPCDAPADALRRYPATSERALGLLRNWRWQPMLSDVRARTLVVRGEHDPAPLEAARDWARSIPGAELLEVPGAGAFPHAERPDLFFPALERFLAGEEPDTIPG